MSMFTKVCVISVTIALATTLYAQGVQGADCAQEIGGVCYTCPEGYPNNVFTNGECFCGKDNGDQVACIRADGASATDSIGTGVTQVVTSGVTTTCVSFLVVLVLGVMVGHVVFV